MVQHFKAQPVSPGQVTSPSAKYANALSRAAQKVYGDVVSVGLNNTACSIRPAARPGLRSVMLRSAAFSLVAAGGVAPAIRKLAMVVRMNVFILILVRDGWVSDQPDGLTRDPNGTGTAGTKGEAHMKWRRAEDEHGLRAFACPNI
ncbi:hypothetical protein [Variovorax sp. YR266]|uniref:hypothetical protein n=1 Tax=Variovorax sp. YR266 TaxID=1884386 RepID=UPI0015A49385|nr:hypothetical protein [Variovorax sp. YR266]